MIAIIPAAGLGSRMAEVTGGTSKEALSLGESTILDKVLDEAFRAGAERAVVVTSREKADVEHIVARRKDWVDLKYQLAPRGLADAIASAGETEQEAFVLLPDTVFTASPQIELLCQLGPNWDGALLSELVTDEQVAKYGILECNGNAVSKILEKPHPAHTASRLAIAGRYAFSDRVLRFITEAVELTPADQPGMELTEILNRAIQQGMKLGYCQLHPEANRLDCGDPAGYKQAIQHFGESQVG